MESVQGLVSSHPHRTLSRGWDITLALEKTCRKWSEESQLLSQIEFTSNSLKVNHCEEREEQNTEHMLMIDH